MHDVLTLYFRVFLCTWFGHQLLLNIVRTNEVKFPEGIVSELHVDCIDMIRKLLKRNPGNLLY